MSLAQIEKRQALKARKQKLKASKISSKAYGKRVGGVHIPNVSSEELINDLKEAKAVTPYTIASKYNLRMSIAKRIIEELSKQGIIQPVTGNSRLRVYKVRMD